LLHSKGFGKEQRLSGRTTRRTVRTISRKEGNTLTLAAEVRAATGARTPIRLRLKSTAQTKKTNKRKRKKRGMTKGGKVANKGRVRKGRSWEKQA
jgi:hypothetical protein